MARKILLETGYTFNPTTTIVSTTGTVGSIVASATSPWVATITGMTSTTGLAVGSFFTATAGTGSLGASGTYRVTSILSSTSITFSAIGGTTPVAGTITNITPTAKQIVIPRYVAQERLVLITNVTTNQVIYNFSDPSLKATTYNGLVNGASGVTSLILNFNTAAMNSTDKLQITIDEFAEKFSPDEAQLDPVNKFRTSSPQALIDTDFEYGTQVTKWENLSLMNNRPSSFASTVPLINVSAITMNTGSRTVTITLSVAANIPNGTPLYIQDSQLAIANGNFVVDSGGSASTTSISYTAKAVNLTTITALLDTNKTVIFQGTTYTGAQIGAAPTYTLSGTDLKLTVTTTVPHGLSIGNEIFVTGITGTNPPNGNYAVASILNPTQFVYYANPILGTPSSLTTTGAAIFPRPQAQYVHRAFDGGVMFSTNATSNYNHAIRQTRRYFRYQSGKGIQFSTGTILRPYATVDALTSSGTTVTVQTREQHNIQPGTTIVIANAVESAYNGTFVVTGVLSLTKFTYTALSTPSASVASGQYTLSVLNWTNAVNRLGGFDLQNGMFWEYDGQTLYAVRRQSVFQLSGKVSATNGSNTISQTNSEFPTAFSKQLLPGDMIVVRGQSYRVMDIASDTSIVVNPPYRGTTGTLLVASKTVDTKTPTSAFNIDRLDGTGPSGYNMDLSKMQMFYIDYSWYGAGFIRFGVRGQNGDVIYAHKIANNNLNNEAYMRSGNLPAHYESNTEPIKTQLAASAGASDTTLTVTDTTFFPSTGTLVLRPGSTTNQGTQNYEYVNYTGKTATSFTGLTRAQAGSAVAGVSTTWTSGLSSGTVSSASGIQIGQRVFGTANPSPIPDGTFVTAISGTTITLNNAVTSGNPTMIFAAMGATSGQAYTYAATSPVSVEYAYPTFAPAISHWGSSVIMDGRFDDDKSLIFNYGQSSTTFTTIASGASKAMFSIRIAPSVDSGIAGAFGSRELINRMQLKMTAMDITTKTSGANMLVRAYLNATPSTATAWTNAVGNTAGAVNSSLAQIADHGTGATTVTGGEVVGGFYVAGTLSTDLTQLRDLGNSILGGGGANSNTNIYPDGPDTLTVVVTNLGASNIDVQGRISWTEAQA
jgi:hypothetical protein